MPRQTDQKEEDLCEEEHSVPGVQRDPGVRRARGEHRGRQPHSESDRLRQVRERQDRRIIQICHCSIIDRPFSFGRIGSNELMGCTAIGADFIGIGREQWLKMLENPRKPVTQWYPLMETIPGHIPSVSSEPLPVSLSCLNSR